MIVQISIQLFFVVFGLIILHLVDRYCLKSSRYQSIYYVASIPFGCIPLMLVFAGVLNGNLYTIGIGIGALVVFGLLKKPKVRL